MGAVEGAGNARADVHREVRAELLLLVEQLAQALAVDQLHHHRLALLAPDAFFDGVIDGDDVGVAQLGDGDGLAAEAFGHDRIGRQRRLEQLHRHLTGERQVRRNPHFGHATLREATLQPVTLGEDRRGQRHGVRVRWGGRHVRHPTLVVHRQVSRAMEVRIERGVSGCAGHYEAARLMAIPIVP